MTIIVKQQMYVTNFLEEHIFNILQQKAVCDGKIIL